jgi:hypothetical protein
VFREAGPLVKQGFLIGMFAGAILGMRLADLGGLDVDYEGPPAGFGDKLVGALVLGGTLGGIGAGMAKLARPEQWDPLFVEPVHVRVSPMLGPRGRGIGASVSIRF